MRGIFAARALARDLELISIYNVHSEQYDVLYKGKQVGYIRLQGGVFRVECPACGGEMVYMSSAMTKGAGVFKDDTERNMNLKWAKLAISQWILDNYPLEVSE